MYKRQIIDDKEINAMVFDTVKAAISVLSDRMQAQYRAQLDIGGASGKSIPSKSDIGF